MSIGEPLAEALHRAQREERNSVAGPGLNPKTEPGRYLNVFLSDKENRSLIADNGVQRRKKMIDAARNKPHSDKERRFNAAKAFFQISAVLFLHPDQTMAETFSPDIRRRKGIEITDDGIRRARRQLIRSAVRANDARRQRKRHIQITAREWRPADKSNALIKAEAG